MASRAAAARQGDAAASSRLVALSAVTAQLAQADDLATMSDVITREAGRVLEADAAIVVVREGPRLLRAHGTVGLTPEQITQYSVFDLDLEGPLGEAVRTGAVVRIRDRADLVARYPSLDDGVERSSVTLPLLGGGDDTTALGAMAFRFDDRCVDLAEDELAVLSVLADVCAATVQRLAAEAERAEQEARLQFLADASTVLASTTDYHETLTQVAGLAVPFHADWCAVEVLEAGVLRSLTVAHVDPAKVALAREVQSRWPSDPERPSGSAVVARTGQSLLIEEVTDEMLVEGTRDPEHLRVARELGLRSALSVPLRAHERVLGVLTFVSAESGRRYSAADIPFAEDLGRRAALAIDNAELYSESRRVAAELQATLSPQELPALSGWEFADLYQQSGRTEVGGDFYDVDVLPDGRLAVVMGDVMGRGVDAAVAGSRLRAATRVLMTQDPHPDALATAVDAFMERDPLIPLASAAYLLVDEDHDEAWATVAGHPPPLLVRADGSTGFMELGRSPLLGVGPTERAASAFSFGPGDMLLLFTDGLVERRGEDLGERLRELREVVAEGVRFDAREGTLGDFLVALAERMLGPERHDDVAILALRRQPA